MSLKKRILKVGKEIKEFQKENLDDKDFVGHYMSDTM
jgi:hypothetical protein